jgi:hypothetical protein
MTEAHRATELRTPGVHVEHRLKCWPEHWKAIRLGFKSFEIRKNDRNYRPGDVLALGEFEPAKWTEGQEHPEGKFTGRVLKRKVTHVTSQHHGIVPGYVVMTITEPV